MPGESMHTTSPSILELETSLLKLERELYLQKSALDSISMDVKALNTSLQNTLLSFGALKEKSDTLFSTVVSIAGDKDSAIDKVVDDSKDRMQSCRSLCDSKNESLTIRLEAATKALHVEMEAVKTTSDTRNTAQDKRLDDLESKANWVLVSGLTIVGGIGLYLLKIILMKFGLPTP